MQWMSVFGVPLPGQVIVVLVLAGMVAPGNTFNNPQYELVRNNGSMPTGAVQLAAQSDGYGRIWTAVAHSQFGDIPGKASGGTCWYPYGNSEYNTQNFSWLVSLNSELILLMNDGSGPPITAVKVGSQLDGAVELFATVAVTDDWGSIPGKGMRYTCSFSYGGNAHVAKEFFWVATKFKLEKKGSEIPSGAVQQAWLDSGAVLYSAVAHTTLGDIPGKANHDTCWYPYNGEERIAESFSYVVAPPGTVGLIRNSAGPPASALRTGYQLNIEEDLYASVAIIGECGAIPGKAKGNQCWYSYNGKEENTSEFSWVTSLSGSFTQDQSDIGSTRRVKRLVEEVYLEIRRDSHTTDRYIRLIGSQISNAIVLHVTRLATTLIRMWDADMADRSVSGGTLETVTENRLSARMDNQGDMVTNGIRFARIHIQTGSVTVAAVFIQIGVNFGRRQIRRALCNSLQRMETVRLERINNQCH